MKNGPRERLEAAAADITENIDNDFSLDSISKTAGFSKYHFHRLFTGLTGIAIGRYIRLARFKRAAYQLAFRKWQNITDIAFDAGYENTESFSRAFKREYGQTPRDFRQKPHWHIWHSIHDPFMQMSGNTMQNTDNTKVDIIDFPETNIAVLEHRGDPNDLKRSIAQFIDWRRQNKLPPLKHTTYNILYDDPAITADDDYRFDLCCAVKEGFNAKDDDIILKAIPAGRCARLRHTGPDHGIETGIRYLIDTWLIASGERLRNFPIFLERVSFFPEVTENAMITDIYLPLE